MKKLYITGVAGTGKSTLARELVRRGLTAIDLDAVEGMCGWVNKATGQSAAYHGGIGRAWIEAHDYVCDVVQLKALLSTYVDESIAVVGWVSNQSDYLDLFDLVFVLQADDETLAHRLTDRTEHDFARDKSEQQLVLDVHEQFEQSMIRVGAIPINATQPVSKVADDILSIE